MNNVPTTGNLRAKLQKPIEWSQGPNHFTRKPVKAEQAPSLPDLPKGSGQVHSWASSCPLISSSLVKDMESVCRLGRRLGVGGGEAGVGGGGGGRNHKNE